MKKCLKCGAELSDDKHFCPFCGSPIDREIMMQTNNDCVVKVENKAAKTLGILSIVFCETFIIGLILGIIGLANAKTGEEKNLNRIGIILSFVCLVVGIIICFIVVFFMVGLFEMIGTGVTESIIDGATKIS